jgi:xylose isomerase
MNIEANHATLAGHTFEHDLRISAINGMLGSIDANQGDYLLGWDTDEFPFDVYTATMCMLEVLKAGGLTGGFNFDAKTRRPSYTVEDMFESFILGMDTFALGLIKASEIIEDGRIDEFVKNRYSSYHNTEIGKKILADNVNLEDLFAYAENLGAPKLPGSGKQEHLESVINSILFK